MVDDLELRGIQDIDPTETAEWVQALEDVLEFQDASRAAFLLEAVNQQARRRQVPVSAGVVTPYMNTLSPEQEEHLSEEEVQRFTELMNALRWNAMAIVMRAGKVDSSLGGHIASYASCALLFEMGFNYFFRAASDNHPGDLVFFQGHSSPGVYARAFLEGRLTETQLDGFRQELSRKGISSYPHPWLMPDFWQFPTVSMGLGPLMAVYQAHFIRYLENRGLTKPSDRKVWAFCGDGEMGEPESIGGLTIAARERLDNLIFVINCNLQRLDGPVWGNGQVIQEYEGLFRGAGWNVIKIVWGQGWDELFARDTQGFLLRRIGELVDGEYQNFGAKDGAYLRSQFFGKYPELAALVADWSDEDLKTKLVDGGHDVQKVYAAYRAAVQHKGQPTVILAKTVKGYGMGDSGEAKNVTHQTKKVGTSDLELFCQRFNIPVPTEEIPKLPYYKPAAESAVMQYLRERRQALGGFLPARHPSQESLQIPELSAFESLLQDSADREFSSTMAYVRILTILLRDPHLKDRIVPVVADECRTFGMEGLFRQIGIYAPFGQRYQPEDHSQLMYYREDSKGQLLQEGLSEASAMASWVAAATSYMTTHLPMIPFYIYYSMFGYQRVGDLVWAAGDMRARGFIIGATAGRTTINGEGLQHEDGHNVLMFSMVPNCVSYDPTFAYEMAVIIQHGLKQMMHDRQDVFYYITAMNENYHHPAMPAHVDPQSIVKGLYLFRESEQTGPRVQLMGSGAILNEVIKAQTILEDEFGVAADIWSATSFNELRKDLEATVRHNRLNPDLQPRISHVEHCLADRQGPVIAATDYMKLFADQIRQGIKAPYYVLGTDGYGRSDTRAALRDFFEVDAKMIAYTALVALADQGQWSKAKLLEARQSLKIDPNKPEPMTH